MSTASVVVTNHDYADYVCSAVDSALGQTWAPTQVVVVDDGSTDGSRPLLAAYGTRIDLVLQPQRGQTAAMNAGFAASTGEVVLFLDADDVLHPDAVASAVEALRDPEAIKAHWPVEVVDAAGAPVGTTLPEAALPAGDLRPRALAEGPQALPFPPTSGNAWRRSFLREVLPLPELEARLGVGSASADALLSMLAALTGRVVALPAALSRYRLHGVNDYAGSSLAARVDRHVRTTDLHFGLVAEHCRARGLPADVPAWRSRSYFHRLAAVRDLIAAAVPPGSTAVVVDGGEWDDALVPSRRLRRFPERDGTWWGPPADDDHAVAALEECLASTLPHVVVVADHCRWWLDAYPGLRDRLHARSTRVDVHEDATLFQLEGAGR